MSTKANTLPALVFSTTLLLIAFSASKAAANPPIPTTTEIVVNDISLSKAQMRAHPTAQPISLQPPPAPEPAACQGVGVAVGQSIQALVDEHPAGTTFCLADGVHRRQTVSPKNGNTFAGPATLDGENTANIAFRPTANNVTIRDLVIERYANPAQVGAIHGGGTQGSMIVSCSPGDTRVDCISGWVVENNVVRYNAGTGIRIGHRMVVRGNKVHHNRQLGVGGVGDGTLVEDNEISYNNYNNDYDPGWEAGGTKFARNHDLVVRNNHVHHNIGPGLWTDGSNMRILYEGNLVEDNTQAGIFHEVSYDAVVRNNTVRRNGFGHQVWMYGAGILIAHSSNVEVYGNTVVDNWNGITGIQQSRGSGFYGPFELRNLNVHDNIVEWKTEVPKTMYGHGGLSGIAQDIGDANVFTNRNVTFDRNAYRVPDITNRYWEWPNTRQDWTGWHALGLDRNGTVAKS